MNEVTSQIDSLASDWTERGEETERSPEVPARVTPRGMSGEFPLSFAQEQIWFLDQVERGNPAYNIGALVRFHGAMDVVALEQALRALVGRHDILRTGVRARDG